ncbi:MAG: hypothetical protein PHF42_05220 [Pseudomonas sp.]|nr:hypothetical protein [Pseudomonas sp.]
MSSEKPPAPDKHPTYDELNAEIERLRRLVAHLAIPIGYQLVPVRPSSEMLKAAIAVHPCANTEETLLSIYRAMLAQAAAHNASHQVAP